jgi:hypothetical protein
LFNEAVCSLVHIPSSASYNQFKRNVKQTKWIEKVLDLLNLNGNEEDNNKEEAAWWIIKYLGSWYTHSFSAVAQQLGLLLAPKVIMSTYLIIFLNLL